MAYLDYSKPFLSYTDASDDGIETILLHKQEAKSTSTHYVFRTLTPAKETILFQTDNVFSLFTQ